MVAGGSDTTAAGAGSILTVSLPLRRNPVPLLLPPEAALPLGVLPGRSLPQPDTETGALMSSGADRAVLNDRFGEQNDVNVCPSELIVEKCRVRFCPAASLF